MKRGPCPIYLLQRVSVAVQRGNAASVLGTTGLAVRILPFFLSSLLLFIFLLLSQLLILFSVVFMFLWRAYVLFVFPLFIYLCCSSRFTLPFSPFFLLLPFPWCSLLLLVHYIYIFLHFAFPFFLTLSFSPVFLLL